MVLDLPAADLFLNAGNDKDVSIRQRRSDVGLQEISKVLIFEPRCCWCNHFEFIPFKSPKRLGFKAKKDVVKGWF